MKRLHIIGAGGLAKEIVGYILGEKHKRYEITGCWANEPFNNSDFNIFYRGSVDSFKKVFSDGDCVLIAIANTITRRKVYEELRNLNLVFVVNSLFSFFIKGKSSCIKFLICS